MLADYHLHTHFSDDSEYPMEQLILDAIAKGIDEICFTEHIDYGVKRDWDDPRGIEYIKGGPKDPPLMPMANVDYPKYMAAIQEYKEKYGDKITIKTGLEFGMQTTTIPEYERLFAKYPFDFIILSIHQVENKEFWNQEYQKGRTQQEYNEGHYLEMLQLVNNYQNYCVLGHIDSIVRYDRCGVYPFEKLKPILTEILKKVIADGKGIEVNTSNRRYGLTDMTPSREILKLYKELGGTILTLGSDTHRPEHLGAYLAETKKELLELGFTHYCTYEKMQPVFHSLED